VKHVVVVELEYQGDLAGILGRGGLDEAERSRIRVASRIESELEVIAGIVGGRVHREAAGRTMFEALIDGQDDEFAGPGEFAVIHDAGKIAAHARILRLVPTENFPHALGHRSLLRSPRWAR